MNKANKRFNLFFGVWFVFVTLLAVGIGSTVVYVAAHFLSKVW